MHHNITQQGSAIFFTMVVTSIVLSVALGLSLFVVKGLLSSHRAGNSLLAFYAAENGIERILYEDITCAGNDTCLKSVASSLGTVTLSNNATYELSVDGPGENGCTASHYCAQSTGVFQGVIRRIEIER